MPYLVEQGFSRGDLGFALRGSRLLMDFRNSSWVRYRIAESARFPARRFDSGGGSDVVLGFVPWATSSIAVMFVLLFLAVGSRGWGGRRVVVLWCTGGAERTWRHCVSVELCAQRRWCIPPLLFLLGMAWFNDWHAASICLLSAPFWWHYSPLR